jgi:hypothetical protein
VGGHQLGGPPGHRQQGRGARAGAARRARRPAASCNAPVTSKTIEVTWSAVTHATTYSVYDSTTSATGTYSLLASGVATTSWTSGTLGGGTRYWFEVVANVGSNWSSVKSAATGSSLINALTQLCIQP